MDRLLFSVCVCEGVCLSICINHNSLQREQHCFLFSLSAGSIFWTWLCEVSFARPGLQFPQMQSLSHTHSLTHTHTHYCYRFLSLCQLNWGRRENGCWVIGMWVRLSRPVEPYKPRSITERCREGVAVGLGSFQINLAEKKFDREAGMFPPMAPETDRH